MSVLTLSASSRSVTGRKVRRLRPEGIIPVVIYGGGDAPRNAQVEDAEFERVLRDGGNSQLVKVDLEGEDINVLVREIQRHPVRHNLLHADFYTVNMSETQQVSVPLVTVGAVTVSADLVMVQSMDSVEIEALPADIPALIEVDVSRLEMPESPPITVADLPTIAGVSYISDADDPICSLILSRAAISEEEEMEEEELLDTDVEPEVIGRGREEEEAEVE
ncbi:MAG: 50S ribosomal protein L25 [Caldilineaceae bacterium SB0665_bin_25]|nr:50S ribosomal protein L25 [Caldilineaceae bacterium SB0665_bin_25]